MSEFKFACPVCGQHITCDAASSGTQMDCPTCFRKLVVPPVKAAGSPNLVLTAALVSSRPSSVGLATDFNPARAPAKQRTLNAVWLLVLLAVCAGAGVFVFRKVIFPMEQSATSGAKPSAPGARPALAVIPPAPDATNWTLNLARAIIPEAPASGAVNGRGFKLERATIQQGRLDLRQGLKWPPDVGVSVHLFAERSEDLARRSVVIEASRTNAPRMILRWKDTQGKAVTETFQQGYALKVEFGTVASNRLPGKIFIAFPDEPRSYAAGTFEAEIRRPTRH